jgi:uncharacterized protein (DUF952 family)
VSERIYHVATRADWERARRAGSYEISTRGRTLAEEGFIHACRREQVAGVITRHHGDADEPLVLLVIDPERLDSPVREEAVDGSTYPHVYGPISRRAVVQVAPLRADGRSEGLLMLFVREATRRMFAAVVVMTAIVAGGLVGVLNGPDWAGAAGLLVGLVIGLGSLAVWRRLRRGSVHD